MSKQKPHRTRSAEKSYSIKICDQPGCKFRGKEAQQGICHTTEGELIGWDKLEAHEKEIVAELADMKRREGKDYVRALEANYICAMLNWEGALDETVRLRRDLAVLKNRGRR
jgi:hypothetical protein